MLHEIEEEFQLALQAGRMGTWDWNVHTGAVTWSPNLEAIHGLPPGSFKGTFAAVVEEIHPDDRAAVIQSISRSLEEGVEHHVEYRIHWSDGSIRWLEGRGRLFHDTNGQPTRMVGVCTDVTERKKADLALIESEQRYRRLLGSVTDYICTVKLDNGCPVETIHGPGCEAVTGYPPEAYAADPYLWYRMIAPEDRDAVMAQVFRVLTGVEVPPIEHRIIHRDGSTRWISNTPVLYRDEQGRVIAYDGLIRDITPRKQAEEALRHSHQQYKSLVNTIDGIVWECDVASGQPTFVSEQALRMLGYSPEQWLGEPGFWEARIHPEDRERVLSFFATLSAEHPAQEIEYRFIASDGRIIWFHDLVRFLAEKGQRARLRGVMVDITQRKRIEEEFQKSHALLQGVIEGTTDAIFVKDRQGRYLMINTSGARLLGKTVEEVIGKDDTAVFSPDTAAVIMEGDRGVMATGQVQTYEDVGTAAGVTRTYQSTKGPYRDLAGNVIGLIGISRDITERKEAERRQIAEHAVTRALAESANLQEATPRIFQAICDGLGWDVAALWEVDRLAGVLRCSGIWHMPGVEVPGFVQLSREVTFARGFGFPGRVWASGEPTWIASKVEDSTFLRYRVAQMEGLQAALGFPVRSGKDFLGVLEFFSREMKSPDERVLATMTSISSQISQFIEHRQAEKALHEREYELGLAREIQLGLLPRTAPAIVGFEIGGASQPAQETGGDYFDFLELADGRLGLAIGDASGHGIPAALLMVETRAYLRALATSQSDVGQILTLANRHLLQDIKPDWFVTLFLASLDVQTRTLVYGSAGHCVGCILDHNGDIKSSLHSTGTPLGSGMQSEYTTAPPVQLEAGDLIFLFTDGLVGARSPSSGVFRIEEALHLIRAHRKEPVSCIIEALMQAVRTHSGGTPSDDMTAVVIKLTASPPAD